MSQQSAPELELAKPSVEDVENSPLKQLAETHWLGKKTNEPTLDNKLISDIYNNIKQHDYPVFTLWILEYLHYLEIYLWPLFTESSSDIHVMSIALMVSAKVQQRLPTWDTFLVNGDEKFSHLFRRLLSLCTSPQVSLAERRHVLVFITGAFQSLDSPIVRKQCAPLVSISIWNNLHASVARDSLLKANPELKKVWRKSCKRFDTQDSAHQGILKFERSWIFSVVSELCQLLTSPSTSPDSREIVLYAERVLELLICLISQLPTRRFTNALLKDIAVVVFVKKSGHFIDEHNILLRQLVDQFEYFMYFPVDDFTGLSLDQSQATSRHYHLLAQLQSVALKVFPEKLKPLALSNYAAVGNREDLMDALDGLNDSQVKQFCNALDLPTDFSHVKYQPTRSFLFELLCDRYVFKRSLIDFCSSLDTLPQTQTLLFNTVLQQTTDYDGQRPLAIPRLDLQYLTIEDFLVRAFQLSRLEAFFEVKNDIRDVVRRLKPSESSPGNGNVEFLGSSKMAVPIPPISILDVAPIPVGGSMPAHVRIEALLDLRRASNRVLSEWESLRPRDVIFLLRVQDPLSKRTPPSVDGIVSIISGEIVQVLDEVGRPLHQAQQAAEKNDYEKLRMGRKRRLEINIDVGSYDQSGNPDQYSHFNLVVRRRQRENNFKPILDSIKDLSLTDVQLPDWFVDVFLGFGDPAAASYGNKSNRLEKLELFDTLIDWDHLVESFPNSNLQIEPSDAKPPLVPPFVIKDKRDMDTSEATSAKKLKSSSSNSILVSSSPLGEQGPYPTDIIKRNTIRYTPAQVEAIISGSNPGLTLIVGPPGTGKTDVVTQVINNIYHNFPNERTLLITHSNHALNKLFEKIIDLDVDVQHLIRLGHGEDMLHSDSSFSDVGRVDHLMQLRTTLLERVNRLATSINAPGAHGSSCETAVYFRLVYIDPAKKQFLESCGNSSNFESPEQVISSFPFNDYFSDTPRPLFEGASTVEEAVSKAKAGLRHIDRIFSQLESIQPLEILKSPKERSNYILLKQARIIALTSTHAAIRRQDLIQMGFHYDNLIVEEAAQLTEIDNVIPMALQSSSGNNSNSLKRVVLVGDHHQNSPVIQNYAFRQYSNLQQSLFERLIRVGVPTYYLDAQGRSRQEIAAIYKGRYKKLENLPQVLKEPKYVYANPGFLYTVQFINVDDYQGNGESSPTPHFIQNLGEAEYAVAIFQYMRLLGYPADKITILAAYMGQKVLIQNILQDRCIHNPFFGSPASVSTIDQYQGQQNDYVIVSLVRTMRLGYLRDIRRLTVALSRARLGLYVLGRRQILEKCFEIHSLVDKLVGDRPDKLVLVTHEMYGNLSRLATASSNKDDNDKSKSFVMENVEHLGQYVYEMTLQKVEAEKNSKVLE